MTIYKLSCKAEHYAVIKMVFGHFYVTLEDSVHVVASKESKVAHDIIVVTFGDGVLDDLYFCGLLTHSKFSPMHRCYFYK